FMQTDEILAKLPTRLDELLAQLPARLEELQRTCSAASAAVTERFFTEQAPQVWVPEGVG
ncbi:MAG: hypothetical protein ACJ71Y_08200, partial [Blastococcus sp.]